MIQANVRKILQELPEGVELVGAAKTRTVKEIEEAIDAGLRIVGHNYVQEAEASFRVLGRRAKWHMIGHLQSNKAKKALEIFDMIETVDSMKLAGAISRAALAKQKEIQVLVEINSGEENQKAGVLPMNALSLIQEMARLKNLKVMGLMTMGPFVGNPEDARPYFKRTKDLFEEIQQMGIENVEMRILSMGMSNSYRIAVEEGATLVRIGTKIFGER
jgi:pyridoxal phosphate enzyme (YggS family)